MALAKQVARGDFVPELDANGCLIRPQGHLEMNPFCRRAVTHAINVARETGGRSRVITMGPPKSIEVGQEALACGAEEAFVLSDIQLAGSDCLITARALASAITQTGPYDIVFAGQSAVDSNTAAIGPMVAELLDIPFLGPVHALGPVVESDGRVHVTAEVQTDGLRETYEVTLPAVIAVAERSTYPAKAPRADWDDATTVTALDLAELGAGPWGAKASPTRVVATKSEPIRRAATVYHTSPEAIALVVDELADRGLLTAPDPATHTNVSPPLPSVNRTHQRDVLAVVGSADGRQARALIGESAVIANDIKARVVAVGPATRAEDFARWGADLLWVPSRWDPEGVARALDIAGIGSPWGVIGLTTAWSRQVLARLAVRLDSGLISDVIELGVSGTELIGFKPSGGDSIATIRSNGTSQLATVHAGALELRSPRPDVAQIPVQFLPVSGAVRERRLSSQVEDDTEALDRADAVIGLGRGVAPEHFSELDVLRAVLSAEYGATRPVTDAGDMPHSRQIGVTAKSIAPRLYLAVGVSGDINHVAGIRRAGFVIAINSDPKAPIFRHADVGIVGDWQAVVPDLVANIRGTRRKLQGAGLLDSVNRP